MKRPLKQVIALLLTFCSLLALVVPPVFADYAYTSSALTPTTLKEGVIYNGFGLSQYYGLDNDYLYVPYNNMLYVYDLDTWTIKYEHDMGQSGTSIGAFVDSKGIVWVYGDRYTIYRYNPATNKGKSFSAKSILQQLEIDKLYSPIEVDGKLYFGAYGPAENGGAHLIEFTPPTFYGDYTVGSGTFVDKGKLVANATYCSAMTYYNGFIYAAVTGKDGNNKTGYVVKYDLENERVEETFDISGKTTATYFDDIQLAGNILFIGGNPQYNMLAIDISGNTMKFATGLTNMPTAGIMRGISEEVNGKLYFFTYNHREVPEDEEAWVNYNDLYSYDIATKTFTKLNSGSAQTGEIRSPQKSIVTIVNEDLGLSGQYILTASIYPTIRFVLYSLDGSSRYELPELEGAEIANRLTSFTKGPDGTNTIYMGSYMNPTAAVYNYKTGEVILQKTYSSQVSQNFHYNGKWYVTNYGACSLSEVTLGSSDNTGTVKTLFSLNEGANKSYFSQERMQNFTGGGNKVFTSTVPHKGELGGFIAWYDYDKKATYVAVEDDLVLYAKDGAQETWYNAKTDAAYTFTGDFDGLVANQMVKTLVYHDGLIYASTTAYGGSQSTPASGETAKLIVYDPDKMEMVTTYDIRDGITGLATDIAAITGIVADPDVPGRFWGLVSGTLFHFTFDKNAKTFNVQEVLSSSKANSSGASPAQWSPWKCYFDDGYLYYFDGTENDGWINMVSTVDPSYYAKLHTNTRSFFVLGEDDNIYSAKGTELFKWNTASIVAQVKANGPGGDGSVAYNGGNGYDTVADAIDAAQNRTDKTVILLQNTTEANVTVPAGVTLDLNGKTLTATDFECEVGGILADRSDGRGMVDTAPGKTVNVAAGDLLLYDSREGCDGYRVYNVFTIAPHGSSLQSLTSNIKRLWINLTFDNEDAYKVIATGNSGIEIGADLTWVPADGSATKTKDLLFDSSYEIEWGTNIQTNKNYGFYIEFTGFVDLPTGTLTLTPTVNEVSSTKSIVYTVHDFSKIGIDFGVDTLPDWWYEA